MKLTLAIVVSLLLSVSAVSFGQLSLPDLKKLESERIENELSLSGGIFYAVGASNTYSHELNVGLRDRILYHLKEKNPALVKALRDRKMCVGFMLDRFFPTAFPVINDANVSDDELKAQVAAILEAAQETPCTTVVVDLFHPASLDDTQKELVESNVPLKLLKDAVLLADETGSRTAIINKAIASAANEKPQKFTLVSFNEMLANLTSPQILYGRRFTDIFQNGGEDIHGNYLGQAHFFNVYLRPSMEKIVGVKISPIAFENLTAYSTKWEDEVFTASASFSPAQIGIGKILNGKDLSRDLYQIKGTKGRGVMTKPGDLAAIDKVVRTYIGKPQATFPVTKMVDKGEMIYEIDFSKLAYEKIKLRPSKTNPGKFVGMGTDYWGMALGFTRLNSKALTNYVFELTEVDEQRVDLTWTILPPVEVNKEAQVISSSVRMSTLGAKWTAEIEANLKEYNHMAYPIQVQIQWTQKH